VGTDILPHDPLRMPFKVQAQHESDQGP
jgi:hypothetical protein